LRLAGPETKTILTGSFRSFLAKLETPITHSPPCDLATVEMIHFVRAPGAYCCYLSSPPYGEITVTSLTVSARPFAGAVAVAPKTRLFAARSRTRLRAGCTSMQNHWKFTSMAITRETCFGAHLGLPLLSLMWPTSLSSEATSIGSPMAQHQMNHESTHGTILHFSCIVHFVLLPMFDFTL